MFSTPKRAPELVSHHRDSDVVDPGSLPVTTTQLPYSGPKKTWSASRPDVSALTSDTILSVEPLGTGIVGPEITWMRARSSPAVFCHHQQVAGFSLRSIGLSGASG